MSDNCDEGQAYAAAMAYAQTVVLPGYAACAVKSDTQTFVGGRVGAEQACTQGNLRVVQSFYFKTPCSSRPEEFGWEGGGHAGTVNACHNGCMYSSALDPLGVVGFAYAPTGAVCTESDAPAPTPAGDDSGGDDGGGTGGETGGGDGGGNDGGGNGGDGGSGGDSGGGDGNGDGDGEGDGDGDGDGNGDGGENPSLPGDPQYPGDIPMPYMDPPIPSSYMGQWSSSLGGGSCPAPLTIGASVGGYNVSITFEFKPLCDFAIKIRAMLIAFSAIVAVYIIVGLRR